MLGVVLATFVLGFLKFGMALMNVPGRVMNIMTGCLLIFAILVPKALKGMRNTVELKEQKKNLVIPPSAPQPTDPDGAISVPQGRA